MGSQQRDRELRECHACGYKKNFAQRSHCYVCRKALPAGATLGCWLGQAKGLGKGLGTRSPSPPWKSKWENGPGKAAQPPGQEKRERQELSLVAKLQKGYDDAVALLGAESEAALSYKGRLEAEKAKIVEAKPLGQQLRDLGNLLEKKVSQVEAAQRRVAGLEEEKAKVPNPGSGSCQRCRG